jgi:hypothetical protein
MGIKIQAGYNFIGGTKFFNPPVAPPTYLRSIDALGIDQQIGIGMSIHSDYIFVSNGRSSNNGELWIYDRSVPDAAPIVFNPPQHGGASWGGTHVYIESQKLLIVSNGHANLHSSSNSGGLVQFFDLTDINNIVTLREYGGTGVNQYIGATIAVGGGKLWTSKYTGAFGEENVLYSFDLDDIQAGPVKYDKPSHVVDHRAYWGAHLTADDDYLYVFDQMGDMYTYIYNVSDFSYVTKVSDPIQSINYRPYIAGDFWVTMRYGNYAVAIYEKGTGNLVKMIGKNIDGETTFNYQNNGVRMYGKYLGLFNYGEPSADNKIWRISFYDTTNWDADPVHLETTSDRSGGRALGEYGSSAIALDPVNNELWWGAGNYRGESSVMIFDASSLMPAPAAAPSSSGLVPNKIFMWSSDAGSYQGGVGRSDVGGVVMTDGDFSNPTTIQLDSPQMVVGGEGKVVTISQLGEIKVYDESTGQLEQTFNDSYLDSVKTIDLWGSANDAVIGAGKIFISAPEYNPQGIGSIIVVDLLDRNVDTYLITPTLGNYSRLSSVSYGGIHFIDGRIYGHTEQWSSADQGIWHFAPDGSDEQFIPTPGADGGSGLVKWGDNFVIHSGYHDIQLIDSSGAVLQTLSKPVDFSFGQDFGLTSTGKLAVLKHETNSPMTHSIFLYDEGFTNEIEITQPADSTDIYWGYGTKANSGGFEVFGEYILVSATEADNNGITNCGAVYRYNDSGVLQDIFYGTVANQKIGTNISVGTALPSS